MRGSLRACPEALRLEDVLATRGLVLFSLDVADYPHATRKVASWVLLGMGRLARQLGDVSPARDRVRCSWSTRSARWASSARHLRGLVGRARESGLAVVLATQGPSDLEAVDRALLPQVLQDTAWQLAFRQGSPQDAERCRRCSGRRGSRTSWRSDGRHDHAPGGAAARGDRRVDERARARRRVAAGGADRPRLASGTRPRGAAGLGKCFRKLAFGNCLGNQGPRDRARAFPKPRSDQWSRALGDLSRPQLEPCGATGSGRALPGAAAECPPELLERMGADMLGKVDAALGVDAAGARAVPGVAGGRADHPGSRGCVRPHLRSRDQTQRRGAPGRLAALLSGPADPEGLDVDHACNVTLCVSDPTTCRDRVTQARGQRAADGTQRSASPTCVQYRASTAPRRFAWRCSPASIGQRSGRTTLSLDSCASCSVGSRSSRTSAAAAAGRRRCMPGARRPAATPASKRSVAWSSIATAYHPI